MLIGVVGFIGCGKGTVGDFLVKRHGFQKDSFANPLKDAVGIIFNWDREMLEGDTEESRNWREQPDPYWSEICEREITPRLALQLFGTECIRHVFHQNVWSASLIDRAKGKNVVVTDCRFRNEVKAIRDNDGIIIHVQRGQLPYWFDMVESYNLGTLDSQDIILVESMIDGGEIPHVSETDWIGSPVDYTIINNGTLDDLEGVVDSVMNMHNTIHPVS